MHWVIQDQFYNPAGHLRLLEVLTQMGLPHWVVKVDPATKTLTPEPDLVNPVMVCGSSTMCGIANSKGWNPGSFLNDNFDFQIWGSRFGELALNHDARMVPFGEVQNWFPQFFIRVVDDSKAFPGGVWNWEDFAIRQRMVLAGNDRSRSLKPDTLVVVAPIKHLLFERRYFVVEGKVISSSLYRVGGKPQISDVPDEECDAFVQKAIIRFMPARAFVIDVAGTPEGIRVVEINCFNSAAFYACNIGKLVEAIEGLAL